MTQPAAKTCDKCGSVLPTDARGKPRYWNTYHLDPATRIPRGIHICAECRTEQTTSTPVSGAAAARQPVLL